MSRASRASRAARNLQYSAGLTKHEVQENVKFSAFEPLSSRHLDDRAVWSPTWPGIDHLEHSRLITQQRWVYLNHISLHIRP
ncbi:hypothetical protein AMS68_000125 [Peltaster fructicola]|uniref:Uncharacterized protein n=1 Tax=Peltaster fructicola TaxID=286661 RepID=A0A6H0XIY5_9PEZI|nr:hypothetical protein AMS68_000125 [Peltaster fructicola]